MNKVRFALSISFLVLLLTQNSFGQKRVVGAVGFYNVENLFDIENDPNEEDEEYTPGGRNKWDGNRFQSKLDNISKVLGEMANGADIVGLAEVENLYVLSELVKHPSLAKHKYQIVHKDSPSWRGIDCAAVGAAEVCGVCAQAGRAATKSGHERM